MAPYILHCHICGISKELHEIDSHYIWNKKWTCSDECLEEIKDQCMEFDLPKFN